MQPAGRELLAALAAVLNRWGRWSFGVCTDPQWTTTESGICCDPSKRRSIGAIS